MADYDGASCVDMTDGFDCPASTNLGCARPWLTTNGGYIASFELWMNENSDWTTYDWEAVATHEIGHTVGLGHAYDVCPCVADDYPTMSSALLANTNCHSYGNLVGANYKATLSSADIEKIRIKYENAVVDIDAGDGGDIPAPPEVYGNEIVCHPNPFNPSTKIEVFVERDVSLSVNIFNLAGERVYEFATRSGANRHFFEWNGRDLRGLVLPAGLYFVVASSEQFILSEKVTLLK
ncbi:MAG: T9SS type A sorting domain-containing protein [Krumholzibacteria bacterium]|nr:T9SS type A sorting domain-containing protein [Candidatus Krumholzibacteria bacterium]